MHVYVIIVIAYCYYFVIFTCIIFLTLFTYLFTDTKQDPKSRHNHHSPADQWKHAIKRDHRGTATLRPPVALLGVKLDDISVLIH